MLSSLAIDDLLAPSVDADDEEEDETAAAAAVEEVDAASAAAAPGVLSDPDTLISPAASLEVLETDSPRGVVTEGAKATIAGDRSRRPESLDRSEGLGVAVGEEAAVVRVVAVDGERLRRQGASDPRAADPADSRSGGMRAFLA